MSKLTTYSFPLEENKKNKYYHLKRSIEFDANYKFKCNYPGRTLKMVDDPVLNIQSVQYRL